MEKMIEDELAATLFKQAWGAVASIYLLILILTLVLYPIIPEQYLFGWAIINLINNGYFTANTLLYHQDSSRYSGQRWINIYLLHSLLNGLLWSPISLLTLYYGDFHYQIFILFVFAGMAAGSIGSRGFVLKAFIAEVVPMMVPIFVYLLWLDQRLYTMMALLVAIYFIFLLFIVKNYSDSSRKTYELLLHNERLVTKLSQSNKDLEQSNTRLTSEIEYRKTIEKQLSLDKERAESYGLAKGRFIANMSHEFRTPLNAIIGFGELLKNSELNQKQSEYVNNIVLSSNHLIDLVNDVLDISRIESGKVKLDYRITDLHCLIDEIIHINFSSAYNKGLILVKDIDPATPRQLYLDSVRIKQILLNLVNNAIKFTASGHVILKASYDQKHFLHCSVIDTGIGIRQQDQSDLFNAFSQLENFEMKRQQGAGLGLTITRNLAELMGGTVNLESEDGRGSVFNIAIPAEPGPANLAYQELNASCQLKINDPVYLSALKNSLLILGVDIVDDCMDKQCIIIADEENIANVASKNGTNAIVPFKASSTDNQCLTPVASFQQIQNVLRPQQQRHIDSPTQSITINATKSTKILVADDNRMNRLVVKSFLEDLNQVEVLEAEDGAQVLSALEQHPDIDLILMDIQMPNMSGIEATQTIREQLNGEQSRVPIIAVTAHAMPEYRRLILSRGFNDCLVKPISQQQLITVIQEWI